MADDVDFLLSRFAEASKVRMFAGLMVDVEDGRAIVDIEGSHIPTLMHGPIPRVDDPVRVLFLDDQPYLWGVTYPQPQIGVVGTIGTGYVQVLTDYGTFEQVQSGGTTPTSGETVLLAWPETGPVISSILTAAPPPPVIPPTPDPVPKVMQTLFTATGSGTANEGGSNWWNRNPYASSSTRGIYTYGRKIRDTLKGAEVLRIEVYLITVRDSGNQPRIGTHPLESVEGTAPEMDNLMSLTRPVNGWELLFDHEDKVNGFADSLRSGGGVGFDGAGYTIFKGVGVAPVDNQVGALRVTYRK